MPDPVDPTVAAATTTTNVNETVGALEGLDQKYGEVSNSSLNFNDIQTSQIGIFDSLSNKIQSFSPLLSNLSTFSDTNTASFGLMSAALIKATESFKDFGNVDTTRLSTFSDQYKKLLTTIKDSPVGSTAAKVAMDALSGGLQKSGASSSELSRIMGDLKRGVVSTAESFLMGADNTLRYQNALIQTAAAQGSMQDLLSKTGAGFENLNQITKQHLEVMEASMGATNMDKDRIQQFMNVLKDLPGGMSNFGDSVEIAGQKTSLLTAAIQYAQGSGRSMADITKDMSKAMNDYGASNENALKYTARMSEMSETLGARTEDVQAAVGRSTDAFKSFVFGGIDVNQMTKGMTDSMEAYVSRLQSVGVPTKNAIEMAQNLQGTMSKLSVAQQSFMSSQTGGPGGIRGALQIEDLMKTDPAAAQKKMEETIRKMTGPLVSREQAKQNEGMAARYEMQIQMLQQGPMGAAAKDPQQAAAMLEAMRTGGPLQVPEAKGTLEEATQRGQAIEQLSMTKVSQMNVQTDSVMLSGGVANLTTSQNMMTARSGAAAQGGTDGTGRGTNPEGVDRLRAAQTANMHPSGTGSEKLLNNLNMAFGNAGSTMMDVARSAKEQFTQDTSTPGQLPAPSIGATKTAAPSSPSLGLGRLGTAGYAPSMKPAGADYTSAGRQVGQALPSGPAATGASATARTATSAVSGTGPASAQPIPVMLAGGSAITVNFTGKCPHCGSNIHTSEQAAIQSPASVARS